VGDENQKPSEKMKEFGPKVKISNAFGKTLSTLPSRWGVGKLILDRSLFARKRAAGKPNSKEVNEVATKPIKESLLYIRVMEDLHDRLKHQASRRGVAVSELARYILAEKIIAMEKEETDDRETIRKATPDGS
jgi:hypothetical protein